MTNAWMNEVEGLLVDQHGDYHGSISPTAWDLPKGVKIEDGYLLFDWGWGRKGADDTADAGDRALLIEFIKLGMAGDETIAEFARKHGALGLCGHGMSKYHPPFGPPDRWPPDVCMKDSPGPEWDAELIETWRDFADEMDDVLWMAASPTDAPPMRPEARVRSVGEWVTSGSIRPGLEWRDGRYTVALGNGTLLGALVVQLMYTVSGGGPTLVLCDGCQSWFAPRRRPPPGKRSWCTSCKPASRSRASRDYRQRNR